jgi:Ca2+-binding RTX toxin-like protein
VNGTRTIIGTTLVAGLLFVGVAAADIYTGSTGIQSISMGGGPDTCYMGGGDDYCDGDGGTDSIWGQGGNDELRGGTGPYDQIHGDGDGGDADLLSGGPDGGDVCWRGQNDSIGSGCEEVDRSTAIRPTS